MEKLQYEKLAVAVYSQLTALSTAVIFAWDKDSLELREELSKIKVAAQEAMRIADSLLYANQPQNNFIGGLGDDWETNRS